jgi:uncharacterized protein
MDEEMTDNEIAQYLEDHPDFFRNHTDLLAKMFLPNPYGEGTVSLMERQQSSQREKIQQMESNFGELIEISRENEAISEKIHQLCLGLLGQHTLESSIAILSEALQTTFHVPQVSVVLTAMPKDSANLALPCFSSISPTLHPWLDGLQKPYCGSQIPEGLQDMFEEGIKSIAVIPLHHPRKLGFILFAAPDEHRFKEGMGTVFISRIGEILAMSIQHHLE